MAEDVKHHGSKRIGLGTAPVYLTAISTILGAILFLRLGYATGTLGVVGAVAMILLGHMITIPTALAISELATNTRVEGGGEYFIISRSFGLKVGSTIGVTLFLAQAISIAFYIIAFTETFQPFFDWWAVRFGFALPKQAISVPTLLILSYVMMYKGSGSGIRMLYIVSGIMLVALAMFFMGKPIAPEGSELAASGAPVAPYSESLGFFNREKFFIIFAICFPAFTGMTAGVGLSGDLKNPGRSIPVGTMLGTFTGLVVYLFVVWKLSVSASRADLMADQMIMSRIALFGGIVIPIGLAACTISSAISSMMVGPRTLQALSHDRSFPMRRLNIFLARGRGPSREPFNASIITFLIALIFILLGNVDSVAGIISMFFLITYGTLCLSSFLNHFGSPPSYRPRFKSKWYISLAGFLLSVWVMFMINPGYTFFSYVFIILIYILVDRTNKERKGLVNIFKGALFQLNRQIQVYMQKHQATMEKEEWRPSAICISAHTFEREKILELMKWISYQHGFGTYFHFLEGYYGREMHQQSQRVLGEILESQKGRRNTLYIDTMISPSYTSAIAQAIQAPSISGMETNMAVFEFDKHVPGEVPRIVENLNMVRAGGLDICIYGISDSMLLPENGINVWVKEIDDPNTNFMILLGYIIMSHPHWKKSNIRIFIASSRGELPEVKAELEKRIAAGRLPATMLNIEIVQLLQYRSFHDAVAEHSRGAALTLIGFDEHTMPDEPERFFTDFDTVGDVLFVSTSQHKDIV